MKTIHKRFIFGVIIILLLIIVRLSGIHKYITLETIRENSEYLLELIQHNYWFAVAIYICFLTILVALFIPLSILFTFVSGYFFGAIPGALYSIIGATLGASISFLVFRYLLRASVQQRYGKALQKFNNEFKRQGASYLLFMQLLPVTPFSLIIMVASLSTVSLWTFIWTSAVGITPGSFIYAFAGRQFMHINKLSDILTWPVFIALVLLACVSLLPLLIRKLRPTVMKNMSMEHE